MYIILDTFSIKRPQNHNATKNVTIEVFNLKILNPIEKYAINKTLAYI